MTILDLIFIALLLLLSVPMRVVSSFTNTFNSCSTVQAICFYLQVITYPELVRKQTYIPIQSVGACPGSNVSIIR